MLNQMDAKRLSKHDIDVKVQCHGGCTIRCLYSHLPNVIKAKPEFILIHMGSNDCTNNTSDEVLHELKDLMQYFREVITKLQDYFIDTNC